MTTVIEVRNLTRRFGDFVAVDHINFQIDAGQVVGYLGPNGSGKTTTMRMLLGLLLPSEGEARVLGFDVARQSEQVRAASGYMSQKFGLYQELSARENLEFYGGLYGVRSRERIQAVLKELGLEEIQNQKAQELSAGWRQRLALATAIVHQPRLLFLDEPSSGVDPVARRAFWDLIYTLAGEGITILVTTHYMDEAEYCERVGIMQAGKLLAMDSPAALKAALPGRVFEIETADLLAALDVLIKLPGVLRGVLDSDVLRVIVQAGVDETGLRAALQEKGIDVGWVHLTQASMEDVFLMQAGK